MTAIAVRMRWLPIILSALHDVRPGGSLATLAMLYLSSAAAAAELGTLQGFDVRLDTGLRVSLGLRAAAQDPTLLNAVNADDGDRAFGQGVMSERLDVTTTLDATRGDFGFKLGADGWYDAVLRAAGRLSPNHRQVLLLVGVEGLSYREISDEIGVPVGTVMSRLARAREAEAAGAACLRASRSVRREKKERLTSRSQNKWTTEDSTTSPRRNPDQPLQSEKSARRYQNCPLPFAELVATGSIESQCSAILPAWIL